MKWTSDWPVIGIDADGDGVGEPALTFKKPNVGRSWPEVTISDSDEFDQNLLGPQWQWHANPATNWMFPAGASGFVRLFNVPMPDGHKNLWDVPNLLLQKFPASEFAATTKITFTPRVDGEKTGLIVMGLDYAYLSVQRKADKLFVSQTVCKDADRGTAEIESTAIETKATVIYLRVDVANGAVCRFSFSTDGAKFTTIGEPFKARQGKWIGAKVGLFAVSGSQTREMGYADVDWFRVKKASF